MTDYLQGIPLEIERIRELSRDSSELGEMSRGEVFGDVLTARHGRVLAFSLTSIRAPEVDVQIRFNKKYCTYLQFVFFKETCLMQSFDPC